MTVKELINKLQEFPEDMDVVDYSYDDIEDVHEGTLVHNNHPYDKPDKQVIIIC
jgi:hypothetical protein